MKLKLKWFIKIFTKRIYSHCDKTTNLVVDKMKDEICGVFIKRFVGLKAEKYSYITEGDD